MEWRTDRTAQPYACAYTREALRNETAPVDHESTKTRAEAASWLADRGFGCPQQTTPGGTADEQASVSPYAGMTAEELRARLRALPDEPAA